MKLIELRNIVRKDIPIYYRRLFTGTAVFTILNAPKEIPVQFTIETSPAGQKEIAVNLLGETDYPLLPLIKTLKDHVGALDREGGLPD
mgnify:CR=1 FL=1